MAWFCRIPRDILISFEIGAREASRPELAGRHYEVLPERTWPAAGSGVAVDIEGACSSVEDLRGSHYERFNAGGTGHNPVGAAGLHKKEGPAYGM